MKQEALPFTVRPVQDMNDLAKAIQARYMAYDRHLPMLAAKLKDIETTDTQEGVLVLLAESKLDRSALGTMRIQTNQFGPLALEESIQLPPRFRDQKLAEATRLGVENGKIGLLVKLALFKACYQYCKKIEVDHLVIAGRAPLDRLYQRWLFEDVFPDGGYVALNHVGNIPHRIMSADLHASLAHWESVKHPLLEFMAGTIHPDLEFDPTLMRSAKPAEAPWRAFPALGKSSARDIQAH
jgi:hypothetical protein